MNFGSGGGQSESFAVSGSVADQSRHLTKFINQAFQAVLQSTDVETGVLAKYLSDGLFLARQFSALNLLPEDGPPELTFQHQKDSGWWFGDSAKISSGPFHIVEAGPAKKMALMQEGLAERLLGDDAAKGWWGRTDGSDFYARQNPLLKHLAEQNQQLEEEFERVAKEVDDQRIERLRAAAAPGVNAITKSHEIIGTKHMPRYFRKILETALDTKRLCLRALTGGGQVPVVSELADGTDSNKVAVTAINEIRGQIWEILLGQNAVLHPDMSIGQWLEQKNGQLPDDYKALPGGLKSILFIPGDQRLSQSDRGENRWLYDSELGNVPEEGSSRDKFAGLAQLLTDLDAQLFQVSEKGDKVQLEPGQVKQLIGQALKVYRQALGFMEWYFKEPVLTRTKEDNPFTSEDDFGIVSRLLLERENLYKTFKTLAGLLAENTMHARKNVDGDFYEKYKAFVQNARQLGREGARLSLKTDYETLLQNRFEKLSKDLPNITERLLGAQTNDAILMAEQDIDSGTLCCGHTAEQLALMMHYLQEKPDFRSHFEHPDTFPVLQNFANFLWPGRKALGDGRELNYFYDPSSFRCAWCNTLNSLAKINLKDPEDNIYYTKSAESQELAVLDDIFRQVMNSQEGYNKNAFTLDLGVMKVVFDVGCLERPELGQPLKVGSWNPNGAKNEWHRNVGEYNFLTLDWNEKNLAADGMTIKVYGYHLFTFMTKEGEGLEFTPEFAARHYNALAIRFARAIQDLWARFVIDNQAEQRGQQARQDAARPDEGSIVYVGHTYSPAEQIGGLSVGAIPQAAATAATAATESLPPTVLRPPRPGAPGSPSRSSSSIVPPPGSSSTSHRSSSQSSLVGHRQAFGSTSASAAVQEAPGFLSLTHTYRPGSTPLGPRKNLQALKAAQQERSPTPSPGSDSSGPPPLSAAPPQGGISSSAGAFGPRSLSADVAHGSSPGSPGASSFASHSSASSLTTHTSVSPHSLAFRPEPQPLSASASRRSDFSASPGSPGGSSFHSGSSASSSRTHTPVSPHSLAFRPEPQPEQLFFLVETDQKGSEFLPLQAADLASAVDSARRSIGPETKIKSVYQKVDFSPESRKSHPERLSRSDSGQFAFHGRFFSTNTVFERTGKTAKEAYGRGLRIKQSKETYHGYQLKSSYEKIWDFENGDLRPEPVVIKWQDKPLAEAKMKIESLKTKILAMPEHDKKSIKTKLDQTSSARDFVSGWSRSTNREKEIQREKALTEFNQWLGYEQARLLERLAKIEQRPHGLQIGRNRVHPEVDNSAQAGSSGRPSFVSGVGSRVREAGEVVWDGLKAAFGVIPHVAVDNPESSSTSQRSGS